MRATAFQGIPITAAIIRCLRRAAHYGGRAYSAWYQNLADFIEGADRVVIIKNGDAMSYVIEEGHADGGGFDDDFHIIGPFDDEKCAEEWGRVYCRGHWCVTPMRDPASLAQERLGVKS
jgi:hypothetical protein